MTAESDVGLIGLAVMGRNLALNMSDHGHAVAVYNRTRAVTDAFLATTEAGRLPVVGCADLDQLVVCLRRPRKVIMMVKAGPAVDDQLRALLPLLEPGDIVVDAGNSHYADTVRRGQLAADSGIDYLGMGVSGGESGARNGPAIMVGGVKHAYHAIERYLRDVAATADGEACCGHVGADGAGHFVKMVHNGIEYADMQLIAEIHALMAALGGLDHDQAADLFAQWNGGPLASYLIEITGDILGRTDPESGRPMIDIIDDAAAHKGTGVWTVNAALDLGVPVPTIAEAVFARSLSANQDVRDAVRQRLLHPPSGGAVAPEVLEQALLAAKIVAYAQGFALLRVAGAAYDWALDLGQIARLWRGGCIIRAAVLNDMAAVFAAEPDLTSLLASGRFAATVDEAAPALRETVAAAAGAGLPVPGLASTLAYLDGHRAKRLGTALIQAQRDYFGAHTYRRTDRSGVFHTDWGHD